ncbi:MAG: hypothetical protein AAF756_05270 [Pseudomonadota bacterium]
MTRLVLLAVLLVVGPTAHAGLVFSGSFNIEFPTGVLGVDSLVGDFSFSFDDSSATGGPSEFFNNLPLDSFNLTSMIGGVAFTTANSGGFVNIRDSQVFAFGIGGLINGADTLISGATDFIITTVIADPASVESFASISIEGIDESELAKDSPDAPNPLFVLNTQVVDGRAQQVPIPATLPLLGFGMLMLRLRGVS